MVKILSIVMLLVLSGCSSFWDKEPIIKEKIVNVAVYQCPSEMKTVVVPNRPTLTIGGLSDADANDPGKVAQYYKYDVKQLMVYSKQLEDLSQVMLNSCK